MQRVITEGDNPYKEQRMQGRFDYVKYDERSLALQTTAKELCTGLEVWIEQVLNGTELQDVPNPSKGQCLRETAVAMTQLEHVYARLGRAIRNIQVARGGDDADVMERSDE